MTPRIALPLPTSTDLPYNQRSWPQYAKAVELSGGEAVPVDLTLSPAELRRLASTCDGVLLPGSPADVNPALYGADREPECAAADPAREAADYILLDDAAAKAKPILGICYGLQSLNTWRGGSLVQDLTPLPVNHSAGGKVAIAHTATVAGNSLLASLLSAHEAPECDGFLRLPVNSSHHQAVAAPGDSLRVAARCPEDGVIEAVELDPASGSFSPRTMFHVEHADGEAPAAHEPQFVLGVQWHPERSFEISAASRALFQRLVSEARRYAEKIRRRTDANAGAEEVALASGSAGQSFR